MKMRFNNVTIERVVSEKDGSYTKCWFESDTPCGDPTLVNLCVTNNTCYIFRPYTSDDSIFLI